MSASEMERLRRRLAAAEAALREIDCCEEHVCRLCDERINDAFRPHAALSGSSAPQAAAPATPEELRGALLAADMVLIVLERGDQSRPVAVVSGLISNARAVIDAALSTATPEDAEGGSQKGSGR